MVEQLLQQLLSKKKKEKKSKNRIKRNIVLAKCHFLSNEHILPCKLRGDQIGLLHQCFQGSMTCTQSR